MTNQEILEKAIRKAIDGGWDEGNSFLQMNEFTDEWVSYIIFNHDFARALWGEEPVREHFGMSCTVTRPAFAHHLQQMVIAEDLIAYIGEHL